MALLTEEEVTANLQKLRDAQLARSAKAADAEGNATARNQYVHPLSDAADAALEAIENTDQRFMLGIDALDFRTRGFGAKELIFITGFAHAGKTQLINTAILNNRDKRILFASMDDPAEMILIKLVCMLNNVDAELLESRVRSHDHESKLALRQAATHVFKNLSIVDDSLGLGGMDVALREFKRLHGAPPHAVIIDYIGSMQGGGDGDDNGIKAKAALLKQWVKDKPFPTIVAHQNTRSRGAPGEPITMMSMGYGGEQEATMVLGVRRKRDNDSLEPGIREMHKNTVTLHLVKNKRPPGKLTPTDGVDLQMEPSTGLIRPLTDADWPGRTQGLTAAADVVAART